MNTPGKIDEGEHIWGEMIRILNKEGRNIQGFIYKNGLRYDGRFYFFDTK